VSSLLDGILLVPRVLVLVIDEAQRKILDARVETLDEVAARLDALPEEVRRKYDGGQSSAGKKRISE